MPGSDASHEAGRRQGVVLRVVQEMRRRIRTMLDRSDPVGRRNRKDDYAALGMPVHDALKSGDPLAVVRDLVDAYPDALLFRSEDDGRLPPARRRLLRDVAGRGAIPRGPVPRGSGGKGQCRLPLPLHLAADSSELPVVEAIQLLVVRFPHALRVKDGEGRLPLHLAAVHGDLEMIRLLADGSPAALEEKDNDGDLPLHGVAGSDRATLEVFRYLSERCPGSLLVANDEGQLPLHVAAYQHHESAELVRCLADPCPESLAVKDGEGNHPLHIVAFVGASADLIRALASARPETLLVRDNDGCLPLHLVAWAMEYYDAVRCLVEVGPDAAALLGRNEDGRLALHVAVHRGAPLPVLQLLADACPRSLWEGDNDGYLPLHVASGQLDDRWGFVSHTEDDGGGGRDPHETTFERVELSALEAVRFLATACPETLLVQAKDGSLPLHVAARNAELDVDQNLANACPDALLRQSNDGSLPLHIAVQHATLEVIQCLANAGPLALQVPAHDGFRPLEVAATHRASLDVVHCLVRTGPSALLP
jgi:ankyrin repeat protein